MKINHIYRHRFVEGNLPETRCIETCWVCLWLFVIVFFALNSFEDVESRNIHRSFVGWTGTELSFPTTFVVSAASASRPTAPGKPPEATRRCTWRRATATSRLRSFCSPKGPQWTPRTTMARGLQWWEAGRRNRVSDLGHLRRFFRAWNSWILRTMDALNIKGLQHLLVNVVVLLDLNFQTAHEFAPAMRGK